MQSSIGIIGGADGSTAIFLAAPADGSLMMAAGVLVLLAAGIWLYCRKRNKSKQQKRVQARGCKG